MYKHYPQHEIKGVKFHWFLEYYDSDPMLSIDNMESVVGKDAVCGNPWNVVHYAQIRDEVLATRPESEINTIDIKGKPQYTINFFKREQIVEEIYETVYADCWAMYSYDDQRVPQTVYFNSLHNDTDEEQNKRSSLTIKSEDGIETYSEEPLKELDSGLTLHLILNYWFMDIVIKKVPGHDMYTVTTINHDMTYMRKLLKLEM